MSELNYPLPEIEQESVIADPRTLAALTDIKTWAGGEIDSTNLKAEGVKGASVEKETIAESKLSKEVKELLNNKTAGGETKKSIIATEQSTASTTYVTLTTPDQVEVVVPTNGLLRIGYQALWATTSATNIFAAIFIGESQLKIQPTNGTAPEVQEQKSTVGGSGAGSLFFPLTSCEVGLTSTGHTEAKNNTGDVTTGQILGQVGQGASGSCEAFVAAGSYTVSIRFKVASGAGVKVKGRKLWVQVVA